MSKTLLNYAVNFTQVTGINEPSLAFLRNIGVVTIPKVLTETPTAVVTVPDGTELAPAVITLSGTFPVGYTLNGEFTSDVQPSPFEAPLTLTSTATAEEAAVLWADFIKGIDQLTAVAVGATIEISPFAPGVDVSVANTTVTEASGIIEVTDPEDLPLLSDQADEIQGVFDGGLNRVYLVLAETAAEIPDLIQDQECLFFTVFGTSDYTDEELITAFSGWLGVKGQMSIDRTFIKDNALDVNQNIYFENTQVLSEASAYGGLFAFGSLLSSNSWRNQQYIPIAGEKVEAVELLGDADSLFDDRASFYLDDVEQGTRLSFFVAGGKSITTPYINKEIQVVMQGRMLNFLASSQPMNVETSRRLLEQIGNNVLIEYIDAELLDPNGVNEISITTSSEAFIVNGTLTTSEAEALWRVQIDAVSVQL